jgi:hypothetical protein
MMAYDVLVEGVELDIEYTTYLDDDGRPGCEIGKVMIDDVDVGPLLYSLNEKAGDVLEAAVIKHLQEDAAWDEVFAGAGE